MDLTVHLLGSSRKVHFSMTITLLEKPHCPQCKATKRYLDKRDIPYHAEELNDETLSLARSLGYSSAPVVLVKDKQGKLIDSWFGFRPEHISNYAN